MKYLSVIEQLFHKKIKDQKLLFHRELKPQIIVYLWEQQAAYRAPFKLLSSSMYREDEISARIEAKHPEFLKRKEYYLFAENVQIQKNEEYEIRALTYKEEIILNKLREACDPKELEYANISIYDGQITGAFYQNKLVGVCCVDDFYGCKDVAILVHPNYRRKKVATTLLSVCANEVLQKHDLCIYRVDDFNEASYLCAKKLGFEKKIEVLFYELEENR